MNLFIKNVFKLAFLSTKIHKVKREIAHESFSVMYKTKQIHLCGVTQFPFKCGTASYFTHE